MASFQVGSGFSASPVAADGKLYLSGEDGDVIVIKAVREFELLNRNPMGQPLDWALSFELPPVRAGKVK